MQEAVNFKFSGGAYPEERWPEPPYAILHGLGHQQENDSGRASAWREACRR